VNYRDTEGREIELPAKLTDLHRIISNARASDNERDLAIDWRDAGARAGDEQFWEMRRR
jgi:hypothetical protein